MTNTQQRIVSAVVMMFILVGFTMVGSNGVITLLFLSGFLLVDELVFHLLGFSRKHFAYYSSQIVFVLGYLFFNYVKGVEQLVDIALNAAIVLNLILLVYLFLEKMEQKSFIGFMKNFSPFSGVFVLLQMISLCFIIKHDNWIILMILLLAFNFSVDTGAWFFGRKFGNKKLWPTISPKKTINGAIGGSILSVIVASSISYFALDKLSIGIILSFLVLSCFAQLGDLIESKLKRQAGIKDSSNLIPGHGGIYDRIDSLVFVAPFFVFLVKSFY